MLKKHIKKFLLGILLIIIIAIAAWLIFFQNNNPTHNACVIANSDSSILVYVNPDKDIIEGGLYYVPTNDVKFISHDDSIKSAKDISPGTMIKISLLNNLIQPTYPASFTEVKSIETLGKNNNELYEKGLADKEKLESEVESILNSVNSN